MGLPAAGKIRSATTQAPLLNVVVCNADAVRVNLWSDLGLSREDGVEYGRRMGWMCDRVAGSTVIADFMPPTRQTRAAFGAAFTMWLDRIDAGRFEDTNQMFVPPEQFDLRVTSQGQSQYWGERALARLRPPFDPQKPTVLFIGHYQTFRDGHQHLIEKRLWRVGQVCIAVRDTHGSDAKSQPPFFVVKQCIEAALSAHMVSLPNITNAFDGREVGYTVERIVLDGENAAISATKMRKLSAVP